MFENVVHGSCFNIISTYVRLRNRIVGVLVSGWFNSSEKPKCSFILLHFFRLHVNSILEDKRKISFRKYTRKSTRHTTREIISNLKKNIRIVSALKPLISRLIIITVDIATYLNKLGQKCLQVRTELQLHWTAAKKIVEISLFLMYY